MTALMVPAVSGLAVRIAEIAPHDRNAGLSLVLGVGAIVAMVSPVLARSATARADAALFIGGAIAAGIGAISILFVKGVR